VRKLSSLLENCAEIEQFVLSDDENEDNNEEDDDDDLEFF